MQYFVMADTLRRLQPTPLTPNTARELGQACVLGQYVPTSLLFPTLMTGSACAASL